MSASEWTHWLFWIGGGGIGLLALALVYWSLFHDRARGRRRCMKCWYDMSQSPTLTCSECGWIAKDDKKLNKTRRRWRWACVGLVLIFASAATMLTPKVGRDGWASIVPTTFLILVVPEYGDDAEFLWFELYRRLPAYNDSFTDVRNRMWDWQWRLLIRRCLARAYTHDVRWFPIDEDSRARETVWAAELALNSLAQCGAFDVLGMHEEIMRKYPYELQPVIRPQCPEGVPPAWRIEEKPPPVVGVSSGIEPLVTDNDPVAEWVGTKYDYDRLHAAFRAPKAAPPGWHEVIFFITHEDRRYGVGIRKGGLPQRVPYGSEIVVTPFEVRGSIDEIVRPVHSEEIDTRLRRSVIAQTMPGGPIDVDVSAELMSLFQTMSFASQIELLENGEKIWEGPLVYAPDWDDREECWHPHAMVYFERDEVQIRPNASYRIRLTGDQMGALIYSDFDSYWAGEVEIPVDTTSWQQRQ